MTLRTAPTPAPRAANPSHDIPSPSPSLSPSPLSGRGEAATREGQPPPPPPYEGNTSPLPPLKRSAFKRGTREITDDDYLNMNHPLVTIVSITVGMAAGAAYSFGGGFVDFLACCSPMLVGCAVVWLGRRWFS